MISKDILYRITAASLEKYLLFNNWIRDYDFPNKKLMVFRNDNETIAMPSSEKYKDFYMTLPNILETLADIYEKSSREIIKEIMSSYHDLLEFRIKSKLSEEGELPLGYASNCIEGLKELILYSACAENQAEAVCMRTTNNAKQVLDNFRLAQTEVGSFIINIDIKVVDEENEQLTIPDLDCQPESSLEHKIVKRIGKAIQQIDDLAKEQSKMDEILPTAYESGVTANICDALMKLKPENVDAEIETKIRYASAVSQKTEDIETVSICNNHFYVMDEISRRYRTCENARETVVRGAIKSLNKKKVAPNRYERNISIDSFADGQYRVIKVELDEESHRNACNAFRDEQEVEISGMLDMSKKVWEMKQINRFKIIEQ